ncbi:cytochrome P450, partial [Streptomyces sp. NRRL WC-3753]
LRPGIEALCARMLDTMERAADENGVVDLKAHYAHPVPMTVITELFGMDSHHIPRLKELFDIFFSTVVPREQVPPMMAELDDIFQAFVQSKRDEPGDDLTSGLLEAAADGDTLTNEE